MSAERLTAIQARLDAATPGPWQRSRFVDGPSHRGRSQEWKADADRRERESVIRGPGVVGNPDCNVVMVFARVRPEDMDLIVHAPRDLRDLLAKLRATDALLMRAVEERDRLAAAERERNLRPFGGHTQECAEAYTMDCICGAAPTDLRGLLAEAVDYLEAEASIHAGAEEGYGDFLVRARAGLAKVAP